jgi:hypothetical protein
MNFTRFWRNKWKVMISVTALGLALIVLESLFSKHPARKNLPNSPRKSLEVRVNSPSAAFVPESPLPWKRNAERARSDSSSTQPSRKLASGSKSIEWKSSSGRSFQIRDDYTVISAKGRDPSKFSQSKKVGPYLLVKRSEVDGIASVGGGAADTESAFMVAEEHSTRQLVVVTGTLSLKLQDSTDPAAIINQLGGPALLSSRPKIGTYFIRGKEASSVFELVERARQMEGVVRADAEVIRPGRRPL